MTEAEQSMAVIAFEAAIEAVVLIERGRCASIARSSVADELSEKFPELRRLAEQIAADIEGDQK